jgi:DNA polymerase I
MYGQREYSLARSLETTPDYGRYYLRQLRQAYPRFHPWIDAQIDWAMLRGYMRSRLGWAIKVNRHTREGTLLNWPMQTTGSEILQRAINQLWAAGISVNASIHDAVLLEASEEDILAVVAEARCIMEHASQELLGSLTIRVEA